jgi:RHS repeat-associated protein
LTPFTTISDFRGNILAYYNSAGGSNVWTAARPTGYGAVPDYRPVALANGANLPQSSAWRGRWPDITGYYHIGLRDLNPVSGGWLSSDSTWNERDPNWYTFAGGEPIMGYDADGRLATKAGDYTLDAATDGLMAADAVWNLGVAFLAPQGDTPQEQAGLTQIALDTFGSPLQRIGIYDSSSDSDVFTKQLPSVLGGPLQNIAMAYAGVPGLQPGEVNASETPVNITPDTEVGAEPTIIPLNSGSATTPITTTTDAAENIAVRQGYLDALKAIPGQIDTTLPLREQAMQAFNLRNAAKIDARAAMSDGGALLNKTDPIPTIQDVVRRAYQEKGLVGDDMWRSILESSTRSRASVNQALGVKP